MSELCPNDTCACDDWPPANCPYCGMQTLGFTPADWTAHFEDECKKLGMLFCFADGGHE